MILFTFGADTNKLYPKWELSPIIDVAMPSLQNPTSHKCAIDRALPSSQAIAAVGNMAGKTTTQDGLELRLPGGPELFQFWRLPARTTPLKILKNMWW